MPFDIPSLPLGRWIESGLMWLTSEYSIVTRSISRVTQTGIGWLNEMLMWVPEWAFIIAVAALCWRLSSPRLAIGDRKSTRLNSSHVAISYAVFCLKKKNHRQTYHTHNATTRTPR